jgi:hypothetical protein
MSKDTFTGRTRFRVHKQWRKPNVLVLQAEFIGTRVDLDGWNCRSYKETYWTDVKPEWMLGTNPEWEFNLQVAYE